MEKIAEQPYSGPVLYIVHAPRKHTPYFFSGSDRKLAAANKKKIFDALEKAGKNGIPVLYESPPEQEWIKEKINSLKHRPRVVWLETEDIGRPHDLRKILDHEKIVPKRIVAFGAFRNICVITGMESMRRAFPNAELVILEGANTIFRKGSRLYKESYRERAKKYDIKRAKKLGRKHLA